jgi:hypothetical protein
VTPPNMKTMIGVAMIVVGTAMTAPEITASHQVRKPPARASQPAMSPIISATGVNGSATGLKMIPEMTLVSVPAMAPANGPARIATITVPIESR